MYVDSIRIWSLSLLGCSLGQWQDSSVTMGTSVFRGGLMLESFTPCSWGHSMWWGDQGRWEMWWGDQGRWEWKIWKPFWRLCRHSRCWNCNPDGPDGKRQIQYINVYYTMRWESCLIVLHMRQKVHKQQKRPQMQRSAFWEILGMKALVTSYHILSSKVQA